MHLPETTPLLTPAEERLLARQIEAGVLALHLLESGERPVPATTQELRSVAELGARAWQHFLLANLRLVWKLAGRESRCTGLPVGELFQEGFVALADALQRYDVERGRFSTFATIRVRQHLAEVGASRFGEVALPPGRALRLRRARGLESALGQERGHTPDIDELAAELGQAPEVTRRLVGYRSPVAIDPLADGPATAIAASGDPDAPIYSGQLRRLLRRLEPEQAQVLGLRYGFLTGEPLELGAVAERLGLSVSTARRLEKRALDALRGRADDVDAARRPGRPASLTGRPQPGRNL